MADTVKHTPGPWEIRKAGNGDRGISAPGTGIFIEAFAEIRHSGEGAYDECDANARLIAAAPDVLSALKLLLADVKDYEPWQRPCHAVDVAEAAIAKAEDRS